MSRRDLVLEQDTPIQKNKPESVGQVDGRTPAELLKEQAGQQPAEPKVEEQDAANDNDRDQSIVNLEK